MNLNKARNQGGLNRPPWFLVKAHLFVRLELLLLGIALGLIMPVSIRVHAQDMPSLNCPDADPTTITYAWGTQVDFSDGLLKALSTFTLVEATEPVSLGIVAFLDGRQVNTEALSATLECGQGKSFDFEVNDAGDARVLHVLPRWLPTIPQLIQDSDLETPLENEDVSRFGIQLADLSTTVLRDSPVLEAPETQLAPIYVPTSVHTEHIFLGDPKTPILVSYLEPTVNSVNFGLFLSETRDEQATYTVTCLLDDKQVPALMNEFTWTAPIAEGQAALIPGQLEHLSAGWHKVQCYVLNGEVKENEGRVSELPHQIWPLFIHVP